METSQIFSNTTFQDDTELQVRRVVIHSIHVSLRESRSALFLRQDLLKELNDAKTELQMTKDQGEQLNKDANKCREEMDKRMMMMVQMDEGLWISLLELDALIQEKKSLTNQLEELTLSSTVESNLALLRTLREEESSLLEQERDLKLKREQLRTTLAEAASNIEEGAACSLQDLNLQNNVLLIFNSSQSPVSQENLGKPGSSSQRKSAEKPVRKRRARK